MRLRFLGTGPARGRPGRGRSRRTESSLYVTSPSGTILIDATRDFAAQARGIDRVELVLLTHPHRDASGGLPQLERWLAHRASSPVPLVSARATLRTVRARYRRLAHFTPRSTTTFGWRDVAVAAISVPHAPDCTTVAWRIEQGARSLVYASDVARLTTKLAAFCRDCDLLVIDGAMWRRRIFSHLEIGASVPIIMRWPVRRVLFTQLGRSTPAHETLDAWLRALDPRFGAAYDGMELEL